MGFSTSSTVATANHVEPLTRRARVKHPALKHVTTSHGRELHQEAPSSDWRQILERFHLHSVSSPSISEMSSHHDNMVNNINNCRSPHSPYVISSAALHPDISTSPSHHGHHHLGHLPSPSSPSSSANDKVATQRSDIDIGYPPSPHYNYHSHYGGSHFRGLVHPENKGTPAHNNSLHRG